MRKCIRGVVVISNTACITNKREMGDDAQRTEKIARINALNSFTTFFFVMASVIYEEEGFELHQTRRCRFHPSISLALMFVSLSLGNWAKRKRENTVCGTRRRRCSSSSFYKSILGRTNQFLLQKTLFSDLTHKGEREA